MIPCPRCGLPIDPNVTRHNLCENCYTETYSNKHKKRNIVFCGVCGKVRIGGKWRPDLSFDQFIQLLQKQGNIVSRAKDRLNYEVVESGEKTVIHYQLKKSLCTNCLIQKSDSYLFEVKVRVEGRAMNQRETMYLVGSIRRTCGENLDQHFVYRFSKNKEGVDVLLSSKKLAEHIVSKLKNEFDGRLTQSFKLISEKHDRTRIFKTTYSYRILSPSVGSVYIINNQLYEVTQVENGEVSLTAIKGTDKVKMAKHELIAMYKTNRIKVLSQNESIV
ncbi:MAG: NMD3-related protein [Thermoprotei archaeon]